MWVIRSNTGFMFLIVPLPDTRILLTFLLDPTARPVTQDMKLWVDTIRFVKRGARGGALGFFTYMELSECLYP